MADLLLELFSEEIPARMQATGAATLARMMAEALAPLAPSGVRTLHGPRRIAWIGAVASDVPASTLSERGPKLAAPEQAVAGFLRKHGAAREDLRQDGGYWLLEKCVAGRPAAALIAEAIPPLLWRFPWPKSMRWSGTSAFTWVRPLRRILCILDDAVVPFTLAQGEDNGHGLQSDRKTEGHRIPVPNHEIVFPVKSTRTYESALGYRRVIADAAARRALIAEGISARAAEAGYAVVPDEGLLDEVAGLVEWPVALLGRIDERFMDLPPEVRQVSMRVNQRYFALSDAAGAPAPAFVFAANVEASDGGAAIVAGNERVLRARLSDAQHFYKLDCNAPLAGRIDALRKVTFHAKLGTQYERVMRLQALSGFIAMRMGADSGQAQRAALLAKADLTTGMVGEFPELQGVMGRYYALHDGEPATVADAIRDHYAPRGPGDATTTAPVSAAVALAEKIDLLAGFFAIDEKPTGSGDPYALRRAALGIIRLLRDNRLRLPLRALIMEARRFFTDLPGATGDFADEVLAFIVERLRVQLRAEGRRHDVLAAAFAAALDDDLTRLLRRADAVEALLGTAEGADLLAAYRRAANILRIEERRGPIDTGPVDATLLTEDAEIALHAVLDQQEPRVDILLSSEFFAAAMMALGHVRPAVDAFFESVTVNAEQPDQRINRLKLLRRLRSLTDRAADFSKLETTGAA